MGTCFGLTVRYARPFGCIFEIQEFHNYLADFPCFWEVEVAGCEGLVTKYEVREALKQVGLNKLPGLDVCPTKHT